MNFEIKCHKTMLGDSKRVAHEIQSRLGEKEKRIKQERSRGEKETSDGGIECVEKTED